MLHANFALFPNNKFEDLNTNFHSMHYINILKKINPLTNQ